MKKKSILIILISITATAAILLAIAFMTGIFGNSDITMPESVDNIKADVSEFEDLNKNIFHTRLSKDTIPPLEDPVYISVENANFLEDADKVFIYEATENVYIFPQKIMVWHEIVNEIIEGDSISITYCPLTGSVIGYEGSIGSHNNNTYGTSGNLLNSNLVMYDRSTDSTIPQILGIAIDNSLEGIELKTKPVYWADWKDARTAYPDALILTLKTGYHRDYFTDPYGSYNPESPGSYYASGEPMFKVMNENDGTFTDKKIVTGIKYKESRMALDPESVKENRVLNFTIGDISAVAFYDDSIKAVRVFNSSVDNLPVELTFSNGTIQDNRNISWSVNGISENGETLEPLTHFDVMWFAWYAYYPETDIIK